MGPFFRRTTTGERVRHRTTRQFTRFSPGLDCRVVVCDARRSDANRCILETTFSGIRIATSGSNPDRSVHRQRFESRPVGMQTVSVFEGKADVPGQGRVWLAAIRTCNAGSADVLRDVRHHLVQKRQAVPITGQPKFVGVRNTALMLVRDHDARRVRSQGGTDPVGLVVADANDPSELVEIEVPDPAADMATQIDPPFLHTRDRAVIGRTACQLLTQASTFDQEAGAKVLLKHRLHHRAATDVANTDTENLFHHPMMFRWLTPSSSGARGRLPGVFSIGDHPTILAAMPNLLLIRHCQTTGRL
jgi:hypothetical protein